MLWAQCPKAVAVSLATGMHLSVPMAMDWRDAQGGLVQSSSAQAPSSLLLLPGAEAVGTFRCSDPAADKEE